jgi:hypothetical protein
VTVSRVTVVPSTFTYVHFDAARIAAVAEKLLDDLELDVTVRIEVDESSPLGRARIATLDPLVFTVEGGAFEDPRRFRELSEPGVADVLGRLLLRVRDRSDPTFGSPGPDDSIPLPHATAWDAYCMGRLARLGYRAQRQRRLYHFRNRHGFTDAADAAFDFLWDAEGLTWEAIASCSDEARRALDQGG